MMYWHLGKILALVSLFLISVDSKEVGAAEGAETDIILPFSFIIEGAFQMGSPDSEANRDIDETKHLVILTRWFEIQKTEVTQSQWFSLMGTNPSIFKTKKYCPTEYVEKDGIPLCPNHPVEKVSWNDIQTFIDKLNKRQDGYEYRLPTEAEWEYAARGGTMSAYSFGNNPKDLSHHAWYFENSEKQTHPVATKAPNPIGLYDMHGNVREWVLDWYKKEYPPSAVINPIGPGSGSARVIRGGAWNDDSSRCRVAVRFNWGPEGRNYGIGFRLIRMPIFSAAFIGINPGTFEMGSPLTEMNRDIDEPPHPVTLTKGFEIQKTELAQSQWFSIMGNNPSHFKKKVDCPDEFREINREVSLCPNHPVESVSWNDIQTFIDKLNQRQDGYEYRLPTEAEWEYAARGGTTSTYSFGDDPKDLSHHAWYSENSRMQTHPVATKTPNPWGLYDIHGNVWEWVSDWHEGRYGNDSVVNPMGPASGSLRVARGGDWQSPPRRSRSANREAWDHLHKSNICGFRLVRIPL